MKNERNRFIKMKYLKGCNIYMCKKISPAVWNYIFFIISNYWTLNTENGRMVEIFKKEAIRGRLGPIYML